MRKKIDLEDDNTAVPRSHIDDEYAHAEERDPKILVTTSRDPSTRLVQFAKEMKLVLPNAQRINRGGQVSSMDCTSLDLPHRITPDRSSSALFVFKVFNVEGDGALRAYQQN